MGHEVNSFKDHSIVRVHGLDAEPGPDTIAMGSNREKVGLTAGQATGKKEGFCL